jgi:hypothetical protein
MKKLLEISLCLLPVLNFASASAQTLSVSQPATTNDVAPVSKSKVNPSTSKEVNGLVLNRFRVSFPDVTDDAWATTANGFFVTFTNKGIHTSAFVNSRGFCESIIRYYGEKDLPKDVRKTVKLECIDYSIKSVKEVTHNNVTAYLVTVENQTSWKVVRVVNGQADIWEEHTKAK